MAALTGHGHPLARGRGLALALVALVVNLPLLQGWWADRQLAAEGVEVRAELVEAVVVGEGDDARPVVAFRLPRQVDERESAWAVEVDRATFEEAEVSGLVEVRVLPGRPSVFEAEGEVRSPVGLVLTLAVDALLAVVVLAARRRRPPTSAVVEEARGGAPSALAVASGGVGVHDGARVVATGDLVPGRPGVAYQPHPDGTVSLRGSLVGIRDDEVVLELGAGARVTVVLEGHRLAVGFGEPAQVRALPLD